MVRNRRKLQFEQHGLRITQINTARLNMERKRGWTLLRDIIRANCPRMKHEPRRRGWKPRQYQGTECSTVGASVTCELQVMVSRDSARWHRECHYWPANCPSLTAVPQEAKYIIISYLNCSFQINISFPSFISQQLQLQSCYFKGTCHFNCFVLASS